MKRMLFLSRCAVITSVALILAACQTTGTSRNIPSCEEIRALIAEQPPLAADDPVRLAYPNATYVGRGPQAEAFVRSGGACRVESNDNKG